MVVRVAAWVREALLLSLAHPSLDVMLRVGSEAGTPT